MLSAARNRNTIIPGKKFSSPSAKKTQMTADARQISDAIELVDRKTDMIPIIKIQSLFIICF